MFPNICLEFMHRAFGAPVGWFDLVWASNFSILKFGCEHALSMICFHC